MLGENVWFKLISDVAYLQAPTEHVVNGARLAYDDPMWEDSRGPEGSTRNLWNQQYVTTRGRASALTLFRRDSTLFRRVCLTLRRRDLTFFLRFFDAFSTPVRRLGSRCHVFSTPVRTLKTRIDSHDAP